MRTRFLVAAVVAACLPATVVAQAPKLGTPVQVEFTGREPKKGGESRLDFSAYRVKEFIYTIDAGDRLRVELESVGGVEMGFWVFAHKDSPEGFVPYLMMDDEQKSKVDWTMAKAAPGKRVKIIIGCTDLGKVNVRISKVGMADEGDASVAEELKKMRLELEALRKENAELRKMLADLKKKP